MHIVFRKLPLQKRCKLTYFTSRCNNCTNALKNEIIRNIRNIGILAHIDAGKTTTTERMLYYSGRISQMGEVHHGNTVTDYMEQERQRGITIRSAAVTFNWKRNQINLIDTPGHIDFTMEVEETLSVLDGAVVILDGSAGVEAQTLTVWRQADRYKIPRLVFVNKMDRSDSDIDQCCISIERKLDKPTLCLQSPIIDKGKLVGLIDFLTMQKLIWNKDKLTKTHLTESSEPELWNSAMTARRNIIDRVGDYNDDFANLVIESDSLDNIQTSSIEEALRKVTLEQTAVPVLCGSAYKNIGVEPLLDSVVLYLPSPDQRNIHFKHFNDKLAARAFKIINDKQRGPLVFFRIYSGTFSKGQKIYNCAHDSNEQTSKLYVSYADEFQEVESITAGNIAVVAGLKKVILGNLISQSALTASSTKKQMQNSNLDEELISKVFGLGAKVPEPVFFCSIEPPSLAYQSSLEQALVELQREDPSLRVTHDTETGQTVLAGMGELHLEIIKDRILKEYKVDADLGPLQIAYHEAPIHKVYREHSVETQVGNTKHSVSISLSLYPKTEGSEVLKFDKTHDAASNLAKIFPKHLVAIKQGVEVALAHGPKISSQVVNVEIMLHRFEAGRGTSETIIAACTTQAIQKLLVESGTRILEPLMSLEIVAPEDMLSTVLVDLNRRRSNILNVTFRGNSKVVVCETPLSELIGFSTALRTITSGTATFTMEFLEYRIMTDLVEAAAIESVRGF